MKQVYLIFSLLALGMLNQLAAQNGRYLSPIFSQVQRTDDIVYGVNSTVILYTTVGQAVEQQLALDLYTPVGDTETERPVVILFHTGNFLPFPQNQGCGGHKRDSAVVEIANRLAKMGYVVAAASYRQGWNPIAGTDELRRQGIINAAYRGIQDARNAIRFFKNSVAEGNDYGVDSTKIVVWGIGTGGYISLNTATLDSYSEIPLVPNGKFFWDHDQNVNTPPIPMVVESLNGNIYGTSLGILQNPMTGAAIDTFNLPNYRDHTSDFALAVNLGGAIADSTFIDGNEPPSISFHVPNDNFAPYTIGVVNVPNTPLQVVEVVGSYFYQHRIEAAGVNDAFANAPLALDLSNEQAAAFANSPDVNPNGLPWDVTDPTPGLYPFNRPANATNPNWPDETAPWDWTAYQNAAGSCTNNKARAVAYIDTIMRFYAPRACFALGLQPCIDQIISTREPLTSNTGLALAPNPATDVVRFTAEEPMLGLEVYNSAAQLVRTDRSMNGTNYTLQRNGLPTGAYIAKVYFKGGVQAIRFVLE